MGVSQDAICKRLGIANCTLYGWMHHGDDFRAELERQRGVRYRHLLDKAYEVMDGQMSQEDALVSWRAGNSVMQHHAQMARAHSVVTHTVVLDKLAAKLQALPADTIDAEYQALADGHSAQGQDAPQPDDAEAANAG